MQTNLEGFWRLKTSHINYTLMSEKKCRPSTKNADDVFNNILHLARQKVFTKSSLLCNVHMRYYNEAIELYCKEDIRHVSLYASLVVQYGALGPAF